MKRNRELIIDVMKYQAPFQVGTYEKACIEQIFTFSVCAMGFLIDYSGETDRMGLEPIKLIIFLR